MISPEEIRRKATNIYGEFIKAWLADGAVQFFPRLIPADRTLKETGVAQNIAEVECLRTGSKAARGEGYSVEWEERASRVHGRNQFPKRVTIDTEQDLLYLAGKKSEFDAFRRVVEHILHKFPELGSWINSHISKLSQLAPDVEGLLLVAEYFRLNPRPMRFARELPLPLPTKFIEWHQKVLREWLDIIQPPASIHAHEEKFESRYGLRSVQPHFLICLLDASLQSELQLPFPELSLPPDALNTLPVSDVTVFIVENRVNALTLPQRPRSLVLGGLGDGVVLLRHINWLPRCSVYYWGDVDAEGFEALSSLRNFCPQANSLFMDEATLHRFNDLIGIGTGERAPKVLILNQAEQAAYLSCCGKNFRIEQEKIPQQAVLDVLAHLPDT